MFKSSFSKIIRTIATITMLGQFLILGPSIAQAVTVADAETVVLTLAGVGYNAETFISTVNADPSAYNLATATSDASLLDQTYNQAVTFVQAALASFDWADPKKGVLIPSTTPGQPGKMGNPKIEAANALPADTDAQTTIKFLALTRAQLDTGAAQLSIARINTFLITVAQTKLTSAKLQQLIAKNSGGSTQYADSLVSAAEINLGKATNTATTAIAVAQSTLASARASTLNARDFSDRWFSTATVTLSDLMGSFNTETAARVGSSDIVAVVDASGAYVLDIYGLKTYSALTATGTEFLTSPLGTYQRTLAAAKDKADAISSSEEVGKLLDTSCPDMDGLVDQLRQGAVQSMLEIHCPIEVLSRAIKIQATETGTIVGDIKKAQDEELKRRLDATRTGQANAAFGGSAFGNQYSSTDEDGRTPFNVGDAAETIVGTCAATIVASAAGALIMGEITAALASASAVLTVPTTDPVLAYPAGTSASFQSYWKGFGDCLVYTMGQLILNNLTENTVAWIKGGFKGSPKYATDLNSLLDGAEDIEGGDFVRQLRGLAVCDFTPSFRDDLANGLELSSKKTSRNMFTDKVRCPYGDGPLLEFSAEKFYSEFSQGGWRAYEASLTDRGNPFGVTLVANREMNARKNTTLDREKQKRSWSSGFADIIDPDDCNFPADISDQMWANNPIVVEDPDDTNYLGGAESVRFYQKSYCKTTTPGKIVEGRLQSTIGTDLNRLGLADSLDKIISALVSQIMEETVKGVFKKAAR